MISALLVKTEDVESAVYVAFAAGVIIAVFFGIYYIIYTLYTHCSITDSSFLTEGIVEKQFYSYYEILFVVVWYFLVIVSINIFGGIVTYSAKKLFIGCNKGK